MTRMRLLTVGVAVAVLSVVAVSPQASAKDAEVPSPAVVKVAFNKTLKKSILVDGRGFTLYLYTADYQGKPACYNDATYHCSKAWIPLRTKGAPRAGHGATAVSYTQSPSPRDYAASRMPSSA
jgi:predicted lipoprotein with Yx(FWY)xxD motif